MRPPATLPPLGLGTALVPNETLGLLVRDALAAGVRLFDTALGYCNEAIIGEAIRSSGVPREEVWIVSKCGGQPIADIHHTLRNLGLPYIDVYLLHWPQFSATDRASCAITCSSEAGSGLSLRRHHPARPPAQVLG